jgi:rare lipoprotein A
MKARQAFSKGWQGLRFAPLMALLALLAACSTTPPQNTARSTPPGHPELPWSGGRYYKDDGPGANVPEDIDRIADARPRDEPVHRGTLRPYSVFGVRYTPMRSRQSFVEEGRASWYGRKFHGKQTATGEAYDMYAMTGAHKTLPLPSYVRVTNLENGRAVVVRVNDRGPFHSDRIIDLSYAAAYKLGYLQKGSTRVRIEAVFPGDEPETPQAPVTVQALATPARPEPVQVAVAEPAAATDGLDGGVDPAAILAGAPLPGLMAVAEAEPGVDNTYVQLGAFSSQDKAQSLLDRVAEELDWLRDRLSVQGDADTFRLHAGPYASAEEAREVARRIGEVFEINPFVVTR